MQILHMFHRKVHPESSTTTKKNDKPLKKENRKSMGYEGGADNGGQMVLDEDIMIFPQRNLSKEKIRRYKSQSNPPQFTLGGCDSNGNREYWIKTDADCKYTNISHSQGSLCNHIIDSNRISFCCLKTKLIHSLPISTNIYSIIHFLFCIYNLEDYK